MRAPRSLTGRLTVEPAREVLVQAVKPAGKYPFVHARLHALPNGFMLADRLVWSTPPLT